MKVSMLVSSHRKLRTHLPSLCLQVRNLDFIRRVDAAVAALRLPVGVQVVEGNNNSSVYWFEWSCASVLVSGFLRM